MADEREQLGRLVRETWVAWAREQDDPKPSWLAGWDELDDGQREADMRIGSAVAAQARTDARLEFAEAAVERASAELTRDVIAPAVAAERERILQLAIRSGAVCTGDEGTSCYFAALISEGPS